MNKPLLALFASLLFLGCVSPQQSSLDKPIESASVESYKVGCQFPSFTWGTINFPTPKNPPAFGTPKDYQKEDLLNGTGGFYFEKLPALLGNGWFLRLQNPNIYSVYQVSCNVGNAVGQNNNYLYCVKAGGSSFEVYRDEIPHVAEDGTILPPTPAQNIVLDYDTPLIVFDLSQEPFDLQTLPVVENLCD